MKVIFNLKKGQQNELLLNLIFPDYRDGEGGEVENGAKEKEVDISTSNSDVNAGCAYTSRLVELKATKTHTRIFKVNRREFYCVVELPLSDYPLYGKQLVARG